MELRHLRYFITVAEASNFTRAADRLRLTQPTLSRQLRDLEEEIGCNLFDRVNHGVHLTAQGRRFLTGAKRLLADSDALLARMRGTNGGETPPLRLTHFGALSAQYFSPFLRKLLRRHCHLRLQLDEETPGEALQQLRAGRLDAALTGQPPPALLRGLASRVIWISPQEVLLAANHPLAKRRRVRLDELCAERWGVWDDRKFPGFGCHVMACCRRAGFRPRVRKCMDSIASIFIHVAAGDFISYAPPIARTLPHPGVAFLPTDPPDAMNLPVLLVWRPDSPHARALEWLADAMAATVPAASNGCGCRS